MRTMTRQEVNEMLAKEFDSSALSELLLAAHRENVEGYSPSHTDVLHWDIQSCCAAI